MLVLAVFFQKTKTGRALRAAADDHQAALSVGIQLKYVWAIVWAAAGFVALVAGLLWGARTGVQFALTFTALKALPVLILGGFESIPGAIVGGLIIGATEKLAEVYIGSSIGLNIGTGIENWFPYMLALAFLLVRPEGLFGEKRIERIYAMFYRLAGQFKSSYAADQQIFPIRQDRYFHRWLADRRVRRHSAGGERLLARRDPDSVPDPGPRRARAEHPHRLHRAALARHRGLHGGGRLRRVQLHPARARHAVPWRHCPGRGSRPR